MYIDGYMEKFLNDHWELYWLWYIFQQPWWDNDDLQYIEIESNYE